MGLVPFGDRGDMTRCAAFAVGLLVATPVTAAADEADGPVLFLGGHLALGAPVGDAGVEVGVGDGWLRGSVGLGLGFRGIQQSAMVRAITPGFGVKLAVGAGVSRGPAVGEIEDPWDDIRGAAHYGNDTVWGNVEIGVDFVMRRPTELRLYVGYSHEVVRDCELVVDGVLEPCGGDDLQRLSPGLPYVGLAVTQRFGG